MFEKLTRGSLKGKKKLSVMLQIFSKSNNNNSNRKNYIIYKNL